MLLASVTSFDQASNCHLIFPRTPASTDPVWTPTRISKVFTPVCRLTLLWEQKKIHHCYSFKNIYITNTALDGYSRYVAYHVTSHFNSTLRMRFVVIQACDAIVTISQNFDSLTAVFLHKKEDRVNVDISGTAILTSA